MSRRASRTLRARFFPVRVKPSAPARVLWEKRRGKQLYIIRYMKRIALWGICAACLTWSATAAAQEENGREGGARRGEATEKRAERLADELGLKDSARVEFIGTYGKYRQELAAHQTTPPFLPPGGKKEEELTEEEAAARIQAEFDRKAQQIVDAYNTLEVEKKYREIFSKTLSAKQMVKIFAPVWRMGGRNGGRPGAGWGRSRMPANMNGFPQGGFGGDDDW